MGKPFQDILKVTKHLPVIDWLEPELSNDLLAIKLGAKLIHILIHQRSSTAQQEMHVQIVRFIVAFDHSKRGNLPMMIEGMPPPCTQNNHVHVGIEMSGDIEHP